MIKKIFIHLYILKLLLKEIFSKYAYFDFKLTCLDDYAKYINSSEGIIYPKNPYEIPFGGRNNYYYIYNFEKVKQDLEKKICIYIVNYVNPSFFAFEYASINEYIITLVDYEIGILVMIAIIYQI